MPELAQCYNKGCGKKFDPEANIDGDCTFHPGPPFFHDAYKIWKCCNKKSTDFGTWLSYPGCTKGKHNAEKPANENMKPVAKLNTDFRSPKSVNMATQTDLETKAISTQTDN